MLQAARQAGLLLDAAGGPTGSTALLELKNSRVSVYPDYTMAVQQQRSSFLRVKRRISNLHLLYPARLKFIKDQRSYFFTELSAAWDWIIHHTAGNARPSRDRDIVPHRHT
ncbi:hypothetical protein NDU88_008064 [Pleurodeles waltl]|uniref:Uncharacterized protein n=1 Tax=Pleurodeles waltl TaxID=8319 RepID=A0AAV7RSQ4_PLEWA|nr:hypothetical protein NDU88_008064 [Pleurodeles waltl]